MVFGEDFSVVSQPQNALNKKGPARKRTPFPSTVALRRPFSIPKSVGWCFSVRRSRRLSSSLLVLLVMLLLVVVLLLARRVRSRCSIRGGRSSRSSSFRSGWRCSRSCSRRGRGGFCRSGRVSESRRSRQGQSGNGSDKGTIEKAHLRTKLQKTEKRTTCQKNRSGHASKLAPDNVFVVH